MDWKQEARELYEANKSWAHIGSIIQKKHFPDEEKNRVQERVRTFIRRTPEYKKGKLVYEDKRKAGSTKELFQRLKDLNNTIDELDTKQTSATVRIEDDKPIGVCFWGDWHTSARGVDYNRLEEDKNIIAETDGLYNIKMGDLGDNASPYVHANGVFEVIATPELQDKLIVDMCDETAERNIAMIRGCHDDWKKRLSDIDFIQFLCDRSDSINLWHGGIINLKFGTQTYRIGARHKYKWESGLNTTNAQRNFINDWGACDVVCFAHKHYPDLQHTKRMGQDMVYLRSGSYKIYDEFGQKLAGYSGQHGVPVVIFMPDKKEFIPFKSLEWGVKFLESLRR